MQPFELRRKYLDFDAYAARQICYKKANSLEECRQLWNKEGTRLNNSNGTLKVEVDERVYLAAAMKSEKVSPVYQ